MFTIITDKRDLNSLNRYIDLSIKQYDKLNLNINDVSPDIYTFIFIYSKNYHLINKYNINKNNIKLYILDFIINEK